MFDFGGFLDFCEPGRLLWTNPVFVLITQLNPEFALENLLHHKMPANHSFNTRLIMHHIDAYALFTNELITLALCLSLQLAIRPLLYFQIGKSMNPRIYRVTMPIPKWVLYLHRRYAG